MSLARSTARKCLHIGRAGAPKHRRPEVPTKLAQFVDVVEQALPADARRSKKKRRTDKTLYGRFVAAGYEGGHSRLAA